MKQIKNNPAQNISKKNNSNLSMLKKEIAKLKKIAKEKKELEIAYADSKLLYHSLIDLSPEAIVFHIKGEIIYANKAAANLFGSSSETEIIGKNLSMFVPEDHKEVIRKKIKFEKSNQCIEPILIKGKKKNGEEIILEALAGKVAYGGSEAAQIIIRDITQQKKAEEELKRLNRALTALIKINQALVVESDEQNFLKDVCKLLIEEAGYSMAWIGFTSEDTDKTIKPIVWECTQNGFLTKGAIFYGSSEKNLGPAELAIRTKKKTVFQNIQKDIKTAKWKKELVKLGFSSVIALPLINNKKVFGVVGIYSSNPNAFDSEETKLLEQLTADLQFGIISLRARGEKEKSDLALRESEQRYRSLVELSPEAIIVHDYGKILYANKAAIHLFPQKSMEELMQKNLLDFVPDEYKEVVIQRMKDALEGQIINEPIRMEVKLPNGGVKYIESIGAPIKFDGKPAGQVFIRDVTSQKMAEEALRTTSEQMRNLATHLQKAREEERTKIAREIHDELGQYLTGLKMDMSFLSDIVEEKICGADKELLNDRIHSASMLLNTTVGAIRRISSELRPAVLDSLGLLAAVEWLVEDFKNRMQIDCDSFIAVDKINLSPDVETAVFRILQESLTNVKKHSAANKVTVALTRDDDSLILEIMDNGKGILSGDFEKEHSFGLLGMQERANLFNGKIFFSGEAGKGTTVTVFIPLQKEAI